MSIKTRRIFPKLERGKRLAYETRCLRVSHYASLTQVESSCVLDAVIVLAGETSSSYMSPCVASHDAGIGSLSFSLFPLSLRFVLRTFTRRSC